MASSIKLMTLCSVVPGFRQQLFRNLFQSSKSAGPAASSTVISDRNNGRRCLSTSRASFLKEISATEAGDKIVIEGKKVPSPREKYLANMPTHSTECTECPLCKLGLTIRHTDVLILHQFLNSKGKILPREVTGLCKDQHKRIQYLVVMAEKAGLIERDVKREVIFKNEVLYAPEEWENPNYRKYYDETVIDEFLYKNRKRH